MQSCKVLDGLLACIHSTNIKPTDTFSVENFCMVIVMWKNWVYALLHGEVWVSTNIWHVKLWYSLVLTLKNL